MRSDESVAREYILSINPGSTSTKVAIFKEEENILQKTLAILQKKYLSTKRLLTNMSTDKNDT